MSVDFDPLSSLDPFAEEADFGDSTKASNYIHIRIQQRNGRKSLTTIQGLDPATVPLKKLLKHFKRQFCCNGTIVNDDALGPVIQLQGDQRKNIAEFLVQEKIAKKGTVKIHGF